MEPNMIEVYGHLGFDFTWFDFEHAGGSPYDSSLLERYTRATDVADIGLFVRLPAGDPPRVRKVLDTGVRTLLVPRVEDAVDIRPAIEAARYRYDETPGTRGAGIGRAHRPLDGDYLGVRVHPFQWRGLEDLIAIVLSGSLKNLGIALLIVIATSSPIALATVIGYYIFQQVLSALLIDGLSSRWVLVYSLIHAYSRS